MQNFQIRQDIFVADDVIIASGIYFLVRVICNINNYQIQRYTVFEVVHCIDGNICHTTNKNALEINVETFD